MILNIFKIKLETLNFEINLIFYWERDLVPMHRDSWAEIYRVIW